MAGSNVPWYEAICIAFGAAECVTVDYNELHYDHPQIRTLTIAELGALNLGNYFDAVFTISSFEHDGLGR
jgi:hypothetical protein